MWIICSANNNKLVSAGFCPQLGILVTIYLHFLHILNFLFLILLLCLSYRLFPRWWLMSRHFMLTLHNMPWIQRSKAQTSFLQECRNSLLLLTMGKDFPRSIRTRVKMKRWSTSDCQPFKPRNKLLYLL